MGRDKTMFYLRVWLIGLSVVHRYGDIFPITPTGRVVACLCSLFGSATIGILVSVLVDRYQRVFARKLFINEAPIDFEDYSDEEDSQLELEVRSDERESLPQALEATPRPTPALLAPPTSFLGKPNRIHFILGYVHDEEQEVSVGLLETVRSIIAEQQMTGENISFSLISHEARQTQSLYGVKFGLDSSSDEDGDREQLKEISGDSRGKGSVLKTFQRRPVDLDQHPSQRNIVSEGVGTSE